MRHQQIQGQSEKCGLTVCNTANIVDVRADLSTPFNYLTNSDTEADNADLPATHLQRAMRPDSIEEAMQGSLDTRNLQQLSEQREQREQQWVNILSELDAEPISAPLQDYLTTLKHGLPVSDWTIDNYIEGMLRFAKPYGPERSEYFHNELNGLHTPNSLTKVWNKKHPQHPITALDQDIRLQCPPGWVSRVEETNRWVLRYMGKGPLSQALNKLIRWMTTMDCGMFSQFVQWQGIRFLTGDGLFDELFDFGPGEFTLTQNWEIPMNEAGTMGNLLYDFYDYSKTTDSLQLEIRIRTRAVFNYPAYLGKHPGGPRRLETVTQIDDVIICFDPETPQNILSNVKLEERLRQTYDAVQDSADLGKLEFYKAFPGKVPPSYSNYSQKSAQVISEDAKKYANHILSDAEWEESRAERENLALGLDRPLNFTRLISCLKGAHDAHLNRAIARAINKDVLSRAKRSKLEDLTKSFLDAWTIHR
ncbi:hypothetical protein G7Y89_g8176 [Cudoniella acicularis]|uniref:Uncharacterized protein n=1 Tax=Cudoniella acicularis TaxID=354080 RepID=A0A8H4RJD3_9HELO|nr:hypothetical protein G7Y89_g8176 [Cudoniella acicularis]